MALTVSQKTAKKKKTFIRWVLKIEVCSCAAILKKKQPKTILAFKFSSFRFLSRGLLTLFQPLFHPGKDFHTGPGHMHKATR